MITVGSDAGGRVLFLWPFEMGRLAGQPVLKWLAQDHANYNLGLYAPGIAEGLSRNDMSRLLSAVAHSSGAAAAVLEAQPLTYDGIANPFAQLPHQPCPSSGYAVTLGDFAQLYEHLFSKRSRNTLERKERKLLDMGSLTYGWAETQEEKLEIIETFFAQKARQFAAMGVKDIFDCHARAFYREVALLEGDNPSRLRLGYIKLNGEVLATFSGTLGHDRLLIVLCSLTDSDLQRQSPGALLIKHQIKQACAEGLALYDFGWQRHAQRAMVRPDRASIRQLHCFRTAWPRRDVAACGLVSPQALDQVESALVVFGANDSRAPIRQRLAAAAQIVATRPNSPRRDVLRSCS